MKDKKILILGGTGFVGSFFKNILDSNNDITYIGRSTQISYKIGQPISDKIKELVALSDIVIFASWNFHLIKKNYLKVHLNSVVEFLELCSDVNTSFLFVSTQLANKNSKSLYNKTKYLCELECRKFNESCIRLGVLLSNINEKGNIYLKLSNLQSIFGYKLMLKPNNKKFKITNSENVKLFFENFSYTSSNEYNQNTSYELYSLTEVLDMFFAEPQKYIFIDWRFAFYYLKVLKFLRIPSRLNLDSLISIWGENL